MSDKALPDLIGGYRTFLRDHYEIEAARYRSLAEFGQAPRTLVIGCSDSRVDPSRIFNARPGELFIVRNVANLVPPCGQQGDYHDTSAALEFAVRNLHLERILVLGHARCGGISAFLDRAVSAAPAQTFIEKWISLLEPAYEAELPRAIAADRRRSAAGDGVRWHRSVAEKPCHIRLREGRRSRPAICAFTVATSTSRPAICSCSALSEFGSSHWRANTAWQWLGATS